MKYILAFPTFALVVALGACSSNGLSISPKVTPANLNSNKATLAVGTARLPDGSVGLNIVATYRQSNGLSATLDNTPSIAGPSGFSVPPTAPVPANSPGAANGWGGSGSDGGTSTIRASSPQPNPNTSPPPSTFGQVGGLFASGFGPYNDIGSGGAAFYPGNSASLGSPYNIMSPAVFPLPFYGTTHMPYVVGPPTVPFFGNGLFPAGFLGYLAGFTTFEATPVAGTYTLSVSVPAASQAGVTQTATASLQSTTALPVFAAPSFTSDGTGGGSGTVTVPAGVTETEVFIVDTTANRYFTVQVSGAGTQNYTLPDNEGPCASQGPSCTPGASMKTGDTVSVYAVGFDYPQFEAEPPGNAQQSPALTGPNGQADLSASPATNATE